MLDRKSLESEGKIREAAQSYDLRERCKAMRVACMHICSHRKCHPMMSWRIDVCWPNVVGKVEKGKPQYQYCSCQGKVLEKVSDVPPTVKVLWDAMPDLDKDSTISNQVLQAAKWKKKIKF
jgi:hypothetical protein